MSLKSLSYRSVYLMSRTVRCFAGQKYICRNMAMKPTPALVDFGKTVSWKNQHTKYVDGSGHAGITTLGGMNRPLYDLYMGNLESKSRDNKFYEAKISEEIRSTLLPLTYELKKSIAFGKIDKRHEDKVYEFNEYAMDYKDKKGYKNYKDKDGNEFGDKKKVPFKTNKDRKTALRTRKQEILLMMSASDATPKNKSQEGKEAKIKWSSFKQHTNRKLLGLAKRDNNKESARLDEIHSFGLNTTPHFNKYWMQNTNVPTSNSKSKSTKITAIKRESNRKLEQYFGDDEFSKWPTDRKEQSSSSSSSFASYSYLPKGTNIKMLKKQFTKNADMRRHFKKSVW